MALACRLLVLSAAVALGGGRAEAQGAPSLSFGTAAPEAAATGAPSRAGRLLVIDRDRVLAESERGRALLAELEADAAALEAENREIEARLRDEERALTERRPEMEADAFRAEADAFDARVQEIREARADKGRALIARREDEQRRFWDEAVPVLASILRERGAVVVLERDSVFLSSDAADITAEAVERIDAAERGAAPAGRDGAEGVSPGGGLDPPSIEPGADATTGDGAALPTDPGANGATPPD